MKKAVLIITLCVLSAIAWVVYSHDDQSGCTNTYVCRAVHATLTCHDLGVYGDEYLGGFLLAENDITVLGAIDAGTVYANSVDLLDEIETHIAADEVLTCDDCYFKYSTSAGTAIQCSGQGVLSKGQAVVSFDETFAGSVDATKPIIVLVTPTDAACKGIAVVKTGINEQIEGQTVSGFCAVELNGGESDSTFNWQALGTRK